MRSNNKTGLFKRDFYEENHYQENLINEKIIKTQDKLIQLLQKHIKASRESNNETDIRHSQELNALEKELNNAKTKLIRNRLKTDKLELYLKIIKEIVKDEVIQHKPNISKICKSIEIKETLSFNLYQDFDKWKRRNPKLYEEIKKEVTLG